MMRLWELLRKFTRSTNKRIPITSLNLLTMMRKSKSSLILLENRSCRKKKNKNNQMMILTTLCSSKSQIKTLMKEKNK